MVDVHSSIHMCRQIPIYIHMYYVCIHVNAHLGVHPIIRAYISYIYIYICVCIRIFTCVYVHVCVYIYIYTREL